MQCAFLKLPELSVLDTAMRIQERERERNGCFGYVRYVWREINKSVDCHSWTNGYLILSMNCWIGDAGSRLPYYHGRFGNPHSRSHSYGTCLIDLVMCLSTMFLAFRLVCLSSMPHFQSQMQVCQTVGSKSTPRLGCRRSHGEGLSLQNILMMDLCTY